MSASGPLQSGTAIASALLRDALQALPDAIAVFDADDRLVFWNDNFAKFYSRNANLEFGDTFEDLIRASVADGLVADAQGREEEWIADRLWRHKQPDHAREHRLANGRWIRTQERRSSEGWSIGIRSDITDLKEQEASFRLLFDSKPDADVRRSSGDAGDPCGQRRSPDTLRLLPRPLPRYDDARHKAGTRPRGVLAACPTRDRCSTSRGFGRGPTCGQMVARSQSCPTPSL